MELVEATLFIGTVIIALTQLIKSVAPGIHGALTILVAALVGVIVALVDQLIGVTDINVATGLMTGLGAAGVVYTAGRVNSHYE